MDLYREPNRHTCPDIDKAITKIWQTVKSYEKLNSEDEDAQNAIGDMIHEMTNLVDTFEYVRKSNDELRCWGNDLVIKCHELEEDLSSKENRIEILESDLDDVKSELESLQDQ